MNLVKTLYIITCGISLLNIDLYAMNSEEATNELETIINEENGKQPQLSDKLINSIKATNNELFERKIAELMSFNMSELIEKLALKVNTGLRKAESSTERKTINIDFLKNIEEAIQYGKNDLISPNFIQTIRKLQGFQAEVEGALMATKKDLSFKDLWINPDDVSPHEMETLTAKLESLIDAYLESFGANSPITMKNILRSLALVIKYGPLDTSEQEQAKRALEEISRNTVGKLLLYRILIEAKEKPFSLYIIHAPTFSMTDFDKENSIYGLYLSPEISEKLNFPIFAGGSADSSIMYKENEPNLDVAIFHELVHLFHKLTNRRRADNYATGKDAFGASGISKHPLFRYYYGDHESCNINNDKWKTSLFVWTTMRNTIGRVNFEEMLTICGLPVNRKGYNVGDELSENLYRASKNLPFRFGHKLLTFVENETIKQKVTECVDFYYRNFKELGTCRLPQNDSSEAKKDYDRYSADMTRLDGIGEMYFYTIPNSVPDEKFELLNLKNSETPGNGYYIRKGSPRAYYYQKEDYCKSVRSSLKLD